MKNYFNRLFENTPKYRFAIWWFFRLLMIYAFIASFFRKPFDITDPLQVGANFLCMFVWEIFMLFPEKSCLRYIKSSVQTFLIIGIFAGSFGGKFLNLYYDFRWWDIILHTIGGGACVFFGYEICSAIEKRDNKRAPMTMVFLCSLGFSFFACAGWELFEFTFDQIACKAAAAAGDIYKAGDAQHWSRVLAEGTPKAATLFNPYFDDRWGLMDTMADSVLNAIGAVISIIFIKIFPYRHK
ncbi:MAG: hypothetical protein K6B52_05310 [Clostridiales bacterium]|nr:hypothetical protein [Clostridiales bacterium]